MKAEEKELFEKYKDKLPWKPKKKMPIAKEFIIADTQYGIYPDYAINMALGWGGVIRWCYRSELVELMTDEEKEHFKVKSV